MQLGALLTSAGINIGLCVLLFSLYSILRKQPSNVNVYFGRRLAQVRSRRSDSFCFDRLVPSPSWILRAWETSEAEILSVGGMDAVVFLRIIVFSMKLFSIAAVVCLFLVLPLNYYGQEMHHKHIPSESLDVFSIKNVSEGSKWLWAHCLALYVITCSACILLYFEYRSISEMRLDHISQSSSNPSHFTVLVRGIPWSSKESYTSLVKKFFMDYHASSYLSHQMVFRNGKIQRLMNDAEKVYNMLKSASIHKKCHPSITRCGLCGGISNSFRMLPTLEPFNEKTTFRDLVWRTNKKECPAAFVFFKTRYAAVVASEILQSSNPMSWVTDLAPEPHDVYWSNLCIRYQQLWIRRIGTLLAAIAFMFVFLFPVTLVQGMTKLDKLQQQRSPFLKEILRNKFMNRVVTGYLPSVILLIFLYAVPPTMMLFSAVEGSFSRSGRKRSACCKVLGFTIWNIFFVNVLSGEVIERLNYISNSIPKDIPATIAKAIPEQATFFMTYVLTSGWTSLSFEIMQVFSLLSNLFSRYILKRKDETSGSTLSFPYHTEIPKLLVFGLLGFTCSVMAPLILPLLLVYFFLAYLVYRNQFLNVYVSKYESGGQFWPIAHNTTIFSLVLSQVIGMGVFGIKRSPMASGFIIPLIILTLLFNEYCRKRFNPIFEKVAAEILIQMDRRDEQNGKMGEIHRQLESAYCQFTICSKGTSKGPSRDHVEVMHAIQDTEDMMPGMAPPQLDGSWALGLDKKASSLI